MKMVMKIDRPRREEVVLDDQRVGQLEQAEQAERERRGPAQEQRVEQQQPTLRLQSKTRFCKNMQVSNKMSSKSSLPKFETAEWVPSGPPEATGHPQVADLPATRCVRFS